MLRASVLNTSQCLHVITAAARLPIGLDLCGPSECIMEEIIGGGGGGLSKPVIGMWYVVGTQEIKRDKEEQ